MSVIVAINGVYHSYFSNEAKAARNNLKHASKHQLHQNLIQKKVGKEYAAKKVHKRLNGYAYEIMSHPVSTISPEDTISYAHSKLIQIKAHHLLVVAAGNIVGIISDRDLFKKGTEVPDIKKIKEIMTKEVVLCQRDTEIRLIAQIMLEENISCLPVINEEQVIQGIITSKDLLKCIVHNMPLEVWM